MRKLKVVLIIMVLGASCFAQKPPDWKEPDYIRMLIAKNEKKAKLPKGLGHCLAYEESRFSPIAKSPLVNGFRSVGLTQLYWKYMYDLVELYSDIPVDQFNWKDPDQNSTVGFNYLADLIHKYGDSPYFGVLAYNYGMTNMKRTMSMDSIPPRCIQYADDIMKLWKEWDETW